MPTYTLKNLSSGEVYESFLSWDELKELTETDSNIIQVMSAPRIVSGVGDALSRTDDGYRDLLKNMKKTAGRNNKINI